MPLPILAAVGNVLLNIGKNLKTVVKFLLIAICVILALIADLCILCILLFICLSRWLFLFGLMLVSLTLRKIAQLLNGMKNPPFISLLKSVNDLVNELTPSKTIDRQYFKWT